MPITTYDYPFSKIQLFHFDNNFPRKVKEVITAIQIERTYTKDEILDQSLFVNSDFLIFKSKIVI